MPSSPDRPAGADTRRRAQGPKSDRLHAIAGELDAQLPELIDGFIFDEVWGRPGLAHEDRMLVAISALGALGRTNQLGNYLWGALHDGVDPDRIQEVLIMLTVYAGFPPAMEALQLWRSIREKAGAQGVIGPSHEEGDA